MMEDGTLTEEITIDDKIKTVEAIIEEVRWARSDPDDPGNRIYHVMKAVAADLRAQRSGAPSAALKAITLRVDALMRQKAFGSVPPGNHQSLSECVISFWPEIRYAMTATEK